MSFFDSGFTIVLTNPGQALQVPQASPQPSALHFVGVGVEYVPDALVGPGGIQIAGVRVKIGEALAVSLTAALANYWTISQTQAALGAYLPLAEVSLGADPSTVARRNVDRELIAATFRGAGLRPVDEDSYVAMYTNDLQMGVQVARQPIPGGRPTLGFYEQPPVARQQVSASSPTIVSDLLDALNSLGLVEKLP